MIYQHLECDQVIMEMDRVGRRTGELYASLKKDADNADAPANKILASINKKYTGCELAKAEDYDTIREMVQNLYGDTFYQREISKVAANN